MAHGKKFFANLPQSLDPPVDQGLESGYSRRGIRGVIEDGFLQRIHRKPVSEKRAKPAGEGFGLLILRKSDRGRVPIFRYRCLAPAFEAVGKATENV